VYHPSLLLLVQSAIGGERAASVLLSVCLQEEVNSVIVELEDLRRRCEADESAAQQLQQQSRRLAVDIARQR
jgi:hypothetical protein